MWIGAQKIEGFQNQHRANKLLWAFFAYITHTSTTLSSTVFSARWNVEKHVGFSLKSKTLFYLLQEKALNWRQNYSHCLQIVKENQSDWGFYYPSLWSGTFAEQVEELAADAVTKQLQISGCAQVIGEDRSYRAGTVALFTHTGLNLPDNLEITQMDLLSNN